jgi:hypothetical protein
LCAPDLTPVGELVSKVRTSTHRLRPRLAKTGHPQRANP